MDLVTSADGTPIAFDRSGTGPSLVLVGGAFQDRTSMNTLAAGLRDSFSAYEYDRRGRGASSDTPPYAIEREVEDLGAVIRAAGGHAFAFGQSSGGALVLEAAARGVPIDALVVNEPPYTEGPTAEFAEHLEALVRDGRSSDAAAAFLELLGTPRAMVEQMQAAPFWSHMESFAPTLSYEVRLCNNGVIPTERLGNISAPVVVLAGETSGTWARDNARVIADAVPQGEARVLAGQGHSVAEDVLIPVLKESFGR